MARILVIEDDESMNDVLVRSLSGMGHEPYSALNSDQAMELSLAHAFSLALTDVILPGQDGIECLSMIRALQPNVRCIVITGYARKVIPAQAIQLKISDYLLKPFTMDQFLTSVDRALKQDESRVALTRQLGRILPGAAKSTEEVVDLCKRRLDAIVALFIGIRSGLLSRSAAFNAYAKIDFLESKFRRAIQPKEPELEKIRRMAGQYETVRQGIIQYRGEKSDEDVNVDGLTPDNFGELHDAITTSKVGLIELEYAPLLRRVSEQKLQSTLKLLELKRRVWPSLRPSV
jgi:CheY-like chemotaxis protein